VHGVAVLGSGEVLAVGSGMKKQTDKAKAKHAQLMKQFKRWSKKLLVVNPSYVKDPKRLRWYLRSPNWDASDVEYAHYGMFIRACYPELYPVFVRMRKTTDDKGLEEYRSLLREAGIEEES